MRKSETEVMGFCVIRCAYLRGCLKAAHWDASTHPVCLN